MKINKHESMTVDSVTHPPPIPAFQKIDRSPMRNQNFPSNKTLDKPCTQHTPLVVFVVSGSQGEKGGGLIN